MTTIKCAWITCKYNAVRGQGKGICTADLITLDHIDNEQDVEIMEASTGDGGEVVESLKCQEFDWNPNWKKDRKSLSKED